MSTKEVPALIKTTHLKKRLKSRRQSSEKLRPFHAFFSRAFPNAKNKSKSDCTMECTYRLQVLTLMSLINVQYLISVQCTVV